MIIGNREFKDYTFVMAIINVTPDSFWHGRQPSRRGRRAFCRGKGG